MKEEKNRDKKEKSQRKIEEKGLEPKTFLSKKGDIRHVGRGRAMNNVRETKESRKKRSVEPMKECREMNRSEGANRTEDCKTFKDLKNIE